MEELRIFHKKKTENDLLVIYLTHTRTPNCLSEFARCPYRILKINYVDVGEIQMFHACCLLVSVFL